MGALLLHVLCGEWLHILLPPAVSQAFKGTPQTQATKETPPWRRISVSEHWQEGGLGAVGALLLHVLRGEWLYILLPPAVAQAFEGTPQTQAPKKNPPWRRISVQSMSKKVGWELWKRSFYMYFVE